MDRRLEGLKRLGGPVGICSHCRSTLLLALPDPGQDIYRHHWRVVERTRSFDADRVVATYVVCSAKCALDLQGSMVRANRDARKNWDGLSPEPCVESS